MENIPRGISGLSFGAENYEKTEEKKEDVKAKGRKGKKERKWDVKG